MDSMNDKRELNVLYVPQEITEAIAQGLTDGIFELTEERLNLGRVIGNGAFGEVYVGEALGIMDDPGWKTVAVKKLAGKSFYRVCFMFSFIFVSSLSTCREIAKSLPNMPVKT